MTSTFTVTEDHLKLIRHFYVGWCDDETGAPAIDPKRPYGNSYVEGDVAEILGWATREELTEKQSERALRLHGETQIVLQILLCNLPDMTGTYVKEKEYFDTSWRKVK